MSWVFSLIIIPAWASWWTSLWTIESFTTIPLLLKLEWPISLTRPNKVALSPNLKTGSRTSNSIWRKGWFLSGIFASVLAVPKGYVMLTNNLELEFSMHQISTGFGFEKLELLKSFLACSNEKDPWIVATLSMRRMGSCKVVTCIRKESGSSIKSNSAWIEPQ